MSLKTLVLTLAVSGAALLMSSDALAWGGCYRYGGYRYGGSRYGGYHYGGYYGGRGGYYGGGSAQEVSPWGMRPASIVPSRAAVRECRPGGELDRRNENRGRAIGNLWPAFNALFQQPAKWCIRQVYADDGTRGRSAKTYRMHHLAK